MFTVSDTNLFAQVHEHDDSLINKSSQSEDRLAANSLGMLPTIAQTNKLHNGQK